MVRAQTLRHLWEAHSGAESEAFAARKNGNNSLGYLLDERCRQIFRWKDIVEEEISFLMADSLQGAIVQLAILHGGLNDVGEQFQNAEDDDLQDVLLKLQRLGRSATDAMHDALGKNYEPVWADESNRATELKAQEAT